MSTTLENETATVGKVSRSARKAYEQSVFDGVCDPAVLFDARRLEIEWRRDRQTYEARAAACETLEVEVPRLQKAAVEAAKRLTDAQTFASLPLPDNVTIADLRQRLHAANYTAPTNTPGELAAGLAHLCNTMPGGHLGTLKSQAIRSQGAIDDTRSKASQVLYQTAADGGPDHASLSLQGQCEELQRRIAARRPALEAEELIKQQRATCEAISRGDIGPSSTPMQLTTDAKANWVRNAYRQARAKLDELFDLLAGRENAIADNERDQAELVKLNEKLQAASETHRARMFAVENMRWCGAE